MKIESEIHIEASPTTVWNVTVDLERWPEWTPTVESIKRLDDGPFRVGSSALIKQPGLPETVWRVTELQQESGFSWEARVRGINMVATHKLAPDASGTKSLLRIEMSGIAAVLLWPLIRSSARKALEQENAGLKKQCEAIS